MEVEIVIKMLQTTIKTKITVFITLILNIKNVDGVMGLWFQWKVLKTYVDPL